MAAHAMTSEDHAAVDHTRTTESGHVPSCGHHAHASIATLTLHVYVHVEHAPDETCVKSASAEYRGSTESVPRSHQVLLVLLI